MKRRRAEMLLAIAVAEAKSRGLKAATYSYFSSGDSSKFITPHDVLLKGVVPRGCCAVGALLLANPPAAGSIAAIDLQISREFSSIFPGNDGESYGVGWGYCVGQAFQDVMNDE